MSDRAKAMRMHLVSRLEIQLHLPLIYASLQEDSKTDSYLNVLPASLVSTGQTCRAHDMLQQDMIQTQAE